MTNGQARAAELFGRPETEQKRLGYVHTLKEICQQPWTWLRTCDRMIASRDNLKKEVAGIRSLALTGSGSSEYAAECVRLLLQNELGICAESISGGSLLMYGGKALPPGRPGLLVSLARSGDSPESSGAVELLLDTEAEYRHVVVTCNEQGSLARAWRDHEKVHVTTLPAETQDKSLVMTSSFTNLLLAARFIGMLERPDKYRSVCERLSQITKGLIRSNFDILAKIAAADFRRAVFLGSGSRFGASREAALKMLEMTSGRVTTLCETYLGFRHGPMSYAQDDTLMVCNLSCDSTVRAYELDLLRELDRKKLGLSKVIIGEGIPDSVIREGDEVIECQGLAELGDEETPIVYVVVAQLLAFFRCLEEGLRPDSPSEGGIINRVVEKFPLHTPS
ncbi:MAG: tagatose-6-phosphate ketose isomerase [Acidobacteria bacterium]|nr:MAG: tagatose-6-phosphate ketose isomerase [Acidobacteriota bacterium]PYT60038.1 MAG: tagatose-6-phosphate ketose isomerase [Acidobacteriota bacterium]